MTQDDLQHARRQLWRQDGRPVLTTEDAAAWLREMGMCGFSEGPAGVPSLAQAVSGGGNSTAATEDSARALGANLAREKIAAPVLLEGPHARGGEQFDVLVSAEVLPCVYCLRGDRDYKKGPAGSPLLVEVWRQLQAAAQTLPELARAIGGEITEAAVLRALRELWAKMRVTPLLDGGGKTRWEIFSRVWPQQARRGATMSHALAVSALISVYLHAAVAATEEEIQDALGPLAARSRVREVLHALQATRQVKMLAVGSSSAYALSGGTAELVQEVAQQRDRAAFRVGRQAAGRERLARTGGQKPVGRKPDRGRPGSGAGGGTGFVRKQWQPREAREQAPGARNQPEGARGSKPMGDRKKFGGPHNSAEKRGDATRKFGGTRKFAAKTFEQAKKFDRRKLGDSAFGEGRPEGRKKFGAPKLGDRAFAERKPEDRKKFGAQPFASGRKFSGRAFGEKKPGGAQKFGGPPSASGRKFAGGKKFGGAAKKFGSGRKFASRAGGAKNFARDRRRAGHQEGQA